MAWSGYIELLKHMVSFTVQSVHKTRPGRDRTVTAPEMARTGGTGLGACCFVSRCKCHQGTSHMSILLMKCSCPCAAGLRGSPGAMSVSAGSLNGRNGGLGGAPARWAAAQPPMHACKQAWCM